MFCTSCGHNIEEGMAFCTSCGAALKAPSQSAPPAEENASSVTAPNAPVGASAAPASVPATAQASAPAATAQMPAVAPRVPAPTATTSIPAPGPSTAAAVPSQLASPPRRRAAYVVPIVVLLVLAMTAGGVFAAYKAGFIGAGKTETVVIDDKDDESAKEATQEPAADEESDEEAPASTTLTKKESFDALQDQYSTLWALHAGIGLQDADGYSGTGFVFEAGGFNQTIGAADLGVRNALVTRCKEWVDKVTAAQGELAALEVDPAYDGQKAALANLYAYMLNRADAMYQAALIAVDRPDRDSGWGAALQPRSKDNRVKFESGYPAAKPVAQ